MTPETIVDVLHQHAISRPQQLAMQHYDGSDTPVAEITYGQLVASIHEMAVQLADRVGPGDTALVAMRFGIDYIVCLLAILFLGGVAIPGMPANRRSTKRLIAMLRVGKPVVMLHDGLNDFTGDILAQYGVQEVNMSVRVPTGQAPPSRRLAGDAAALLQFTSGSTATPKGVVISHANIVANQIAIAKHFDHQEGVQVLGWLPLFHDMGLIGNVLQPLFLGGTAMMQAPFDVISQPLSWLKLIEKTRAHTSGGPNFIYDLCVRRVSEEEAAGLDLSRWETAYNGSEPVRQHTLERFAEKFRCSGFKSTSMFPCYGMAEASLFVSGRRYFAPHDDAPSRAATDSTGTLVSCGAIDEETTVVVCDPVSLEARNEGASGEIFIAGPSVASAYLDEQGIQIGPFTHRLTGHPGRDFHRTGDIGKIEGRQLFVTGRAKDTIKIRGVTYHAEDMESIIERECSQIEDHAVCVFGLPVTTGVETVAAVVEISRATASPVRSELFKQIREAVSLHAGVTISKVYFVLRGSLSRTSSGKFVRSLCRENLANGSLAIIEEL